jgi:hypothetical protein
MRSACSSPRTIWANDGPVTGWSTRDSSCASSNGTYYVKLTDPRSAGAFQNSAFPDYFYFVSAREFTPGTPGTGFESEVDFTNDEFSGYSVVTLVGEFHDRTDSVFNFAGKDGQALIGRALASGVHGNGSTARGGHLQVASEKGTILAGIDRDEGQTAIHPPIDSPTTYGCSSSRTSRTSN